MKAYTDIEQSKKLAEILPLESADMVYVHTTDLEGDEHYDIDVLCNTPLFEDDIYAWSLAALLNYLREVDFFPDIEADEHSVTMNINYYNEEEARPLAPMHNIKVEAESFIDACYNMILKLYELKML